jgi:hypothetical protein
MPAVSKRALRFVRALATGGEARLGSDGLFRTRGARVATLAPADVAALQRAGILVGDSALCRAGPEAAAWLRRQLADDDPYGSQHRQLRTADGHLINLAESPLGRLAAAAPGEVQAFLLPHQVEAGERLRRLVQRAQLLPRVTMSYNIAQTAGRGSRAKSPEISDMAADARRTLAEIMRLLPQDCAGVVLDVCGLEKGLQAIESERGWPRRSAKLVLRIGLEQLARHFGLSAVATGRPSGSRAWMEAGARPAMFDDE